MRSVYASERLKEARVQQWDEQNGIHVFRYSQDETKNVGGGYLKITIIGLSTVSIKIKYTKGLGFYVWFLWKYFLEIVARNFFDPFFVGMQKHGMLRS